MKLSKLILPAAFVLLFVACSKNNDIKNRPDAYTMPVKVAPYLYEMTFYDYSPEKMLDYVATLDKVSHGAACSVVRNGNFVGRNLDYYYDEEAEFIVHVPRSGSRLASVGVSAGNMNLTAKMVDGGKKLSHYDLVPYFMTDGINEKGVYASINMAPTGDLGLTTGTNPGAETTLCASMVVRFVLDNCSSAAEACALLENTNITTLGVMGEFHFFIADESESYIVETIDNKLVYSKDAGNIETNFYHLHEGYTPHACGVERYEYLKAHAEEAISPDKMAELMESVRYSLSYDFSMQPFWWSEYYGYPYKGVDITIDTPHEFYLESVKSEIKKYENRKRNYLLDVWITTHTSVYDFAMKTLTIFAQEDYSQSWKYKVEE